MTKHSVKTIATGEYSCSCGAVWDRDEGSECPASKPSAEELKACRNCGGKCDPTGWMCGDGHQGPECEGCGITTPDVESWNRLMSEATPWIPTAERRPMDWGDPDGVVEVQVSDGIKTGTAVFFKKSGAMGWKHLRFTNVKFWQHLAAAPKL